MPSLEQQVQDQCPNQPEIAPLNIKFNAHAPDGLLWTVEFVYAMTKEGNRRKWDYVRGKTLSEALRNALPENRE